MTAQEHQVCLLLGSNIQPRKNLALAVDLLRSQVKIVRVSSVWETPAVGSPGPDFLNLAVLVITSLDAGSLKEQIIRPLEAQLGRVRSADKNAPRTMDIDIVLFDNQLLDPNLWRFAHRAVPVADILPGYRSDNGDQLKDIALQLAEKTPVHSKPDLLITHYLNQMTLKNKNSFLGNQ
jgi:2-amino-4-hydroxy-6-hydroxymethyldihydropteridine diphosphokinase